MRKQNKNFFNCWRNVDDPWALSPIWMSTLIDAAALMDTFVAELIT